MVSRSFVVLCAAVPSLAAPTGPQSGSTLQQEAPTAKRNQHHSRTMMMHQLAHDVARKMEERHPEKMEKMRHYMNCSSAGTVCSKDVEDPNGAFWSVMYSETRRQSQEEEYVQYLLNNCAHGFLPVATRDCSPANNLTGGQGMVILSDEGLDYMFGAAVKVDSGFCGINVEMPTGPIPWNEVRQDGVSEPIFNGCYSDPNLAYTKVGPCGQFSKRDYVIAANQLGASVNFDPRSGGIGLTSETAKELFPTSTGGQSVGLKSPVYWPYSILHRAQLQAAFECLGGWYACEMFMCQHCPGCCQGPFPGNFDWVETPSSWDGTYVGPNMFETTPPHYIDGSDVLQMP